MTGPNLAGEMAFRQPMAAVVACIDEDRAALVQQAIFTPYFRPYTNDDVIGCELGGAVKNVIALACGMAIGMGFGDNTKATLITRGLAETIRLGVALGADPVTFAGLAGMGDLVATCASPLSRNRTFGVALGQGLNSQDATRAARFTAEGVKSCGPILQLAQSHGVDMPITEAVVAIVEGNLPLNELGARLLGRPRKPEGI
jgi:glycerol-3-phosphate dehydrogenase (NAD(P)+)